MASRQNSFSFVCLCFLLIAILVNEVLCESETEPKGDSENYESPSGEGEISKKNFGEVYIERPADKEQNPDEYPTNNDEDQGQGQENILVAVTESAPSNKGPGGQEGEHLPRDHEKEEEENLTTDEDSKVSTAVPSDRLQEEESSKSPETVPLWDGTMEVGNSEQERGQTALEDSPEVSQPKQPNSQEYDRDTENTANTANTAEEKGLDQSGPEAPGPETADQRGDSSSSRNEKHKESESSQPVVHSASPGGVGSSSLAWLIVFGVVSSTLLMSAVILGIVIGFARSKRAAKGSLVSPTRALFECQAPCMTLPWQHTLYVSRHAFGCLGNKHGQRTYIHWTRTHVM